MMKDTVNNQLSLFGLKPTAKMMQRESLGQLAIDILEITEPPKEMLYDRFTDR